MKERYYAPGVPPKGYNYQFHQDGWVLVREEPIVHSDYNVSIGIVSAVCIIVAVVITLAVIL